MTNSMKQKLAAGELVLCMNLRLARTVDIAMVAKAGGYDALYVDMEHSSLTDVTLDTVRALHEIDGSVAVVLQAMLRDGKIVFEGPDEVLRRSDDEYIKRFLS